MLADDLLDRAGVRGRRIRPGCGLGRVMLVFTAVSLAAVPGVAAALGDDIDVALQFSHTRTEFTDGASRVETQIRRATLSLYEQAGPGLRVGVFGGAASVSQKGQALTAGMSLSGNFLGVDLRSIVYRGDRFRILAGTYYLWQHLEDQLNAQQVRIDWDEYGIGAGVAVDLGERWLVHGGANLNHIDADQKASGPVTETRSFRSRDTQSGFLNIALNVDPGGYIGVSLQRGGLDSTTLFFQRLY